MVRRMVEAINAGEEDAAVEELFAPRAARRVRLLFAEFRSAFPDWREEIVELVAEGDAVAGRGGREVHKPLGARGQHRSDAPAWTPALDERRVVENDPISPCVAEENVEKPGRTKRTYI